MTETIGNPLSWTVGAARAAGSYAGAARNHLGSGDVDPATLPRVRKLTIDDLVVALRRGVDDFAAARSDAVFLCIFYPILGIALIYLTVRGEVVPLIFPLMVGFALIGPAAAVGLYEISRRRERGEAVNWATVLADFRSPSFGPIVVLGLLLMAIFFIWMVAAHGIWAATLGPLPHASVAEFLSSTLTTWPGWAMIVVGCTVGLLFATAVLAISVVSFPLLLDRPVGLPAAVVTSIRVMAANPGPIFAWGAIVALALAIGSIPLFLGLVLVIPVLGHATWHLYRRAVEPAVEMPADAESGRNDRREADLSEFGQNTM